MTTAAPAPAHARRFGASSAERHLTCLASGPREAKLPNPSNYEAREGSAAHWVAEDCLKSGHRNAMALLGCKVNIEGGEPIEVDEEMVEGCQVYIDYVRGILAAHPDAIVRYETRVQYRRWLPPYPLCTEEDGFGTADCIIILPSLGVMIVIDLKYGRGHRVNVIDNVQCKMYALGALDEYDLTYDIQTIQSVIVQPRNGGITEDYITATELLQFGEYLRQRATLILTTPESQLPAAPGLKQCQFCRAKAQCPEFAQFNLTNIIGDFEDLGEAEAKLSKLDSGVLTVTMSASELQTLYPYLDMISAWVKAIDARMLEETRAGHCPEYKLVEGRKGDRAWRSVDKAESALLKAGVKERYQPAKLITPTEAERILGKKTDCWATIKEHVWQPDGKLVVAPIDDKRKAIRQTPSENDFQKLDPDFSVNDIDMRDLI